MRVNLVIAVLAVALVGAAAMPAQTIGVVLDNGKNIIDPFGGFFGGSNDDASTVNVFDADADPITVLGSVDVNLTAGSSATGILSDCSLSGDATTAFVGYISEDLFGSPSPAKELVAVDISTPDAPVVSTRIAIATSSVDTSITPDGKFVLVCDSVNPNEPVSVVKVATKASIAGPSGQLGCRAVEACSDGSVLIGRPSFGMLHRLSIDATTGTLTDTGESISGPAPQNVDCAPSAASGVFVSEGDSTVYSVAIPLAGVADSEGTTDGEGVVVLVHPDGNRVFVRLAGGDIDVFDYDQATGLMTTPAAFTILVDAPSITSLSDSIEQGVDTMAFTPDGSKLYVVAGKTVQVFDATDATDGSSLGSFGTFDSPTGICFARGAAGPPPPVEVVIDVNPGGDCIKNNAKGVIPVAIYGSADFDVTQIDFSTVELESLTIKIAGQSGTFQVEFSDLNLASFTDVVVKIDDSASVLPSGDIEVTLIGALLDGTEFEGAQTICVK